MKAIYNLMFRPQVLLALESFHKIFFESNVSKASPQPSSILSMHFYYFDFDLRVFNFYI